MSAYLISWKPLTENSEKGWAEANLVHLAQEVKAGRFARESWRFRRRSGVKAGERVFLVQQGKRGYAILGYGHVFSTPSKSEPHLTPIEFEELVDTRSGAVLATREELLEITPSCAGFLYPQVTSTSPD